MKLVSLKKYPGTSIFILYVIFSMFIIRRSSHTTVDVSINFFVILQVIFFGLLCFFYFYIFLKKNKFYYPYKSRIFLYIPIMFFITNIIYSPLSLNYKIVIYKSIDGLIYILLALFFIREHIYNNDFFLSLKKLFAFIYILLFLWWIPKFLVAIGIFNGFLPEKFQQKRSFLEAVLYGYTYGMGSVFGFIFSFWFIINYFSKLKKQFIKFLLSFGMGLYFHSFAALVSSLILIIFISLIKRKYLYFFIFIGISITSAILLYNSYVLNPDFKFFGKDLSLITTGTGRFIMWNAGIDYILNADFLFHLKGIGLLTERYVLKNYEVPWVNYIHTSILETYFALGLQGLIMLILWWTAGIYISYKNYKKAKFIYLKNFNLWVFVSHILLVIMGIQDSKYFGQANLFLSFSIILIFMSEYYTKNQFKGGLGNAK
jgi:hypothetical protein